MSPDAYDSAIVDAPIETSIFVPGLPDVGETPEPCTAATFEEEAFSTPYSRTGPFGPDGVIWPLWDVWIAEVSGALSFPGLSVLHPYPTVAGQRVNQISPYIPRAPNPGVFFTVTSIGGATPTQIGLTGPNSVSDFGAFALNTEYNIFLDDEDPAFIALWFGGTYSSAVTGTGVYHYVPYRTGTALDSSSVAGGIGRITIVNSAFGVKKPYSGNANWNRNVVTGEFIFRVDHIPATGTPYSVEVTYGAAKVEIRPSSDSGEVRLVSGSGETAVTKTDWTPNAWYVLDITLDLDQNILRARLWPEADPADVTTVTRAANGEQVGAGGYLPFIGIWLDNPSTTPLVFEMRGIRSNAFAPGTIENIDFGVPGTISTSGWGAPWTTYLPFFVPGVDPSLQWEALPTSGLVRMIDQSNVGFGSIRRALPNGTVDLYFSVANYPTGESAINTGFFYTDTLLTMRFAETPEIGVTLGNVLQIGIGFDAWFGTTTVFDGSLVNCRINIHGGGVRVKVWQGSEPLAWTLEVLHALDPFPALFWDIQPWSLDTNGQVIVFGPTGGQASSLLIIGPDLLAFTGISATYGFLGSNGNGRNHQWPFSDPMDGRSYGVGWGNESFTITGDTSPVYTASMAWGLFGNWGPGARKSCGQTAASLSLPQFLIRGIPIPYDVVVRGDIRANIGGNYYLGGQQFANVTCVIKSLNYGAALTAPPPGFYDYSMLSGAEGYYPFLLETGGTWHTQPFEVLFRNQGFLGGVNPDGSGGFMFQWTLEILNVFDILAGAGPLVAPFVGLPNTGSLSVEVLNVTYELRLRPDYVFGVGQPDACAASGIGSGGTPGYFTTALIDQYGPIGTGYAR